MFESLVAFAIAMTVLAASPGPGLAAVLSRSLGGGVGAGMRVVLGLILVDFLFLGVAVLGLSAIASALGPLFQVIKYMAALYLIYLGVNTLFSVRNEHSASTSEVRASSFSDILLGSLVTLGNPKAILFYGALLPTFFDVPLIGPTYFLLICCVIVLVSLFVYGVYILLAEKSVAVTRNRRILSRIQIASGVTLIGAGGWIALRE